MVILEIIEVAKEAGKEFARIDGEFTKIINESKFFDKEGKEKSLEKLKELLKEEKIACEQIEEVESYLNKLKNDINKFKPGWMKAKLKNHQLKKLEQDVKTAVEIEKPSENFNLNLELQK